MQLGPCERQDVGGAAGALAHHHRDGGALLEVVQHGQDHVGTPLKDQGHDGDTLADSYGKEEEEEEDEDGA
ncbi:hypothetical protein EYF80_045676 [Liparis tanakae]|uniref:Uncharacterized protein n=1 Tax=Liparis tanakae TaxID=230148 RepID=A0A4Z2FTE3_9TELE|nr:hypothetical protein EYF80_045676 [Liparis tanakae]